MIGMHLMGYELLSTGSSGGVSGKRISVRSAGTVLSRFEPRHRRPGLTEGQKAGVHFGVNDPRPAYDGVNRNVEDVSVRLHNWDLLVKNVRAFYRIVASLSALGSARTPYCRGFEPQLTADALVGRGAESLRSLRA
ncbi:protein daple [Plakobranchus ocellatus]|uniref:Protein daple n=1 Tax=Plakobranchus ocellatus TaxID=259542 RepID=A0AAV3ZWU1_9GAST|nr:protein daple [Plakobranchus ocellatus]